MKIDDLKKLYVDLIVPQSSMSEKKRRSLIEVFNTNFHYDDIFYELEIPGFDITKLWGDPVVDNIVVKTFFDEVIKYYHPENCLLSKSRTPKTTGTKRALNQEELFDLFKKILVPLPPIKQSELSELTDIFNSNFTSDNFSEVLLEEFDWDEIYEDPGMHDVDIKQRIKQELEKLL